MKVTRRSLLSGKKRTMDIPNLDEDNFRDWESADPKFRMHVQFAFPHLTADQREFIMTGITPDEWDITFNEEE